MVGGPPGGPGVVGKPSLRSGSGREALPEVLEWSRGPPGGPGGPPGYPGVWIWILVVWISEYEYRVLVGSEDHREGL